MQDLALRLMSVSCWDEYRDIISENRSILLTDDALEWISEAKSRLHVTQGKKQNNGVCFELSLMADFIGISRDSGESSALLRLQHRKRYFLASKNEEEMSAKVNEARDFLSSMLGKDRSEVQRILQENIEYLRSPEFITICQQFLRNISCMEREDGMPIYARLVELVSAVGGDSGAVDS